MTNNTEHSVERRKMGNAKILIRSIFDIHLL